MKRWLHILLLYFFLSFHYMAFSSHIVGGSLTYVYNGGSSYTITLKLYRDCSGIPLPSNVSISVLGYDGATFSPSKDFTMNLGTVTPVPSGLPACSTPPVPLPCTQEGIYTTTVNNFPPNVGGYHLFWQLMARNYSLTNVNSGCMCVGESLDAFIPSSLIVYGEDFTLANGTTVDNGTTAWSIGAGTIPPNSAKINNNMFEIKGANNAQETFTSQIINIAASTGGVNIKVDLSKQGTLDPHDSILVYYRLNGGSLTLFSTNGSTANNFANKIASQSTLTGNTLQVVIRVHFDANSPNSEIYDFDNLLVSQNIPTANSSPTFTYFPPLFICKGQPLSFDHSATDADGDSLVYSFYDPYDGDPADPSKYPTFSGNTATFLPVTFLGGYSSINPLGGAPLNISSTGLLTGTPPALGQYVVGIAVKEYRNGVYLDETIRDFQFNVVTCSAPLSVNITSPVPVICFGSSSTTITAHGVGGTPPYHYLWNNTNPSQAINVGIGTYTVKLTDVQNCTPVFATVTVTSYTVPVSANAGIDQKLCKQSPTTTLNGAVFGPSTGVWTGGAGVFSPDSITLSAQYTPTAAEIVNGFVDLTLTTTGSGNCPIGTDVVRINYLGFLGVLSVVGTNVSCFGNNDGAATVSNTGGSSPYTYFWTNSQTAATITTLPPSTYSVTITDSIGCTSQTSVTITQPTPLASNSVVSDVSCSGGNNGSISITASDGTPPYTYLWSPGNQTTSSITGQAKGTYTVTVTDSLNCSLQEINTITEPTALSLSLASTDVSCFNGNNGVINSTVSGGTSTYTYNWSSGATSPNLSGLLAGTYSLTVTDFKSCTTTQSVVIAQPTLLTAGTSSTDITCNNFNNGTATALPNGGTTGYSYLWQSGLQTTETISNLTAGTYTLSLTDSKGCLATAFATVTEPSPLAINIVSQTNVRCFGGNNGAISTSISGGTPNYSYSWSPGAGTTNAISNLTSGTYSLTITDSKSCVLNKPVSITQPLAALTVSVSATSVTCFGKSNGAISASIAGGTTPYSYIWMPGNLTVQNISNLAADTYSLTVNDAKGCNVASSVAVTQPSQMVLTTSSVNSDCGQPNGQTSVSASGGSSPYSYSWSPSGGTNAAATGLIAGTYSVTVTDLLGCTSSAQVNVSENLAPIVTIISVTNVSCNGGHDGSATLALSGGIGPFTYLWSPSGGTDSIASGLISGSYTANVLAANGCKSSVTTNPAVLEPPPIIATVATGIVSCFGGNDGTASVSASGGTPGYTYIWLPGGTTGSVINNLLATTYTVQVTDLKGCVKLQPFTIAQPSQLMAVISPIKNVSCFQGNDGEATVTVSGGTQVYNYQWLPIGGNGPIGKGFSANTYTVTVTDFKSCVTSASVAITQPAIPLSATGTGGATKCSGGSDGTAMINPIGGTPNYSYQWSPSGGTAQNASGLSAQNYFVVVTDNNGCLTNTSVIITEPTAVSGALVSVSPSCGLPNGSISSQVSGGASPYTYLWSSGSLTSSGINGVGPGTYTLQITDAQNCTLSISENLVNIPGATVAISSVNPVSCFGGNDGSATINITLGSPPYSIDWLPYGGNNLSASALIAASYTVNATDSLGCISSVIVPVAQPTAIGISISSLTNVLCHGDSTGSITVSATGGTPAYSYLWSPTGSSTSTINHVSVGTYTVNVSDKNNCPESISINITQPPVLLSSIANAVNPTCYGLQGSASVVVTGGTIPYSYSWSTNSVLTGSTENVLAGSYTITITDANSCLTSNMVTLTEPSQVITIAGVNDTVCVGQNAMLSAHASGGAGNYYYAWQPTGVINAGTLNLTPTGDTTYIVVAYDKIGCPGTPDTTTAYAYFLAKGSVNAQGISPICPGRNSVVSAKAISTAGPLTYQWNNNLGTGPGEFIVTPLQPTTYVVTATSSVCGTSVVDSVHIAFNPEPTLALSSDSSALCVPGALQFFDHSITGNISDPINSWNWNFGDGTHSTQKNPKHTFNQEGTYFVTLTINTSGGCTTNNSVAPLTIEAHQYPIAAFTINSPILNLPVEKLIPTNKSIGASIYNWNFGDGGNSTEFNPQYNYSTVGVFQIQLIATSQYDCSDTAYAEVTTSADFIFPNVFTPNTNGPSGGGYDKHSLTNDVFFPYTSGVIKFKIEIFNRWGELIFVSDDINVGWDGYYKGQLCQQDVYIWKAFLKLNNGKEYNKSGDVTLLR